MKEQQGHPPGKTSRTICHCCGSDSDVACPICGIYHCRECQSDPVLAGQEFIPLGFCPDCRSVLAAAKSLSNQPNGKSDALGGKKPPQANLVAVGPGALEKEQAEVHLFAIMDALYIASRSVVPLALARSLKPASEKWLHRLFGQNNKKGSNAPVQTEAFRSLPNNWGRLTFILRRAEGALAESTHADIIVLFNELIELYDDLFGAIVHADTNDLLTPAGRKLLDERWRRAGRLILQLNDSLMQGIYDRDSTAAAISCLDDFFLIFQIYIRTSRSEARLGPLPVIFEILRFNLFQTRTILSRTGLPTPRTLKSIRNVEMGLASLYDEVSSNIPNEQDRVAFKLFLHSTTQAMEIDSAVADRKDREAGDDLILARNWTWSALCATRLTGILSMGDGIIPDLWSALLTSIDWRLRRLPRVMKPESLPPVDAPLEALYRLLDLSDESGLGTRVATELVLSAWNLSYPVESEPDPRAAALIRKLANAASDEIFQDYLCRLAGILEASPEGTEMPLPIPLPERWSSLEALPGVSIKPDGRRLRAHLWVVIGDPEEIAAMPLSKDDLTVGLERTRQTLCQFASNDGWSKLVESYTKGNRGRPISVSLIAVIKTGKKEPLCIVCGKGGSIPAPFREVPGIRTLHDAEMLAAAPTIKDAHAHWNSAHSAKHAAPQPPDLYLVDRSCLTHSLLYSSQGEKKK